MSTRVGMNKTVKREWLDKTVELVQSGAGDAEIRKELQEYLTFEIGCPTTIKNSRTILLQTWVYVPDEFSEIKKEALKIATYKDENSVVAHWCMMLLAYPLLVDMAGYIGKLSDIQETFTVTWLKDKLREQWGERATILEAVSKILLTMKNLGVVQSQKLGTYTVSCRDITNENAISLILKTIVALRQKAYYEIAELSAVPQMFPFNFGISHEWLHSSNAFSLTSFGGNVVLSVD